MIMKDLVMSRTALSLALTLTLATPALAQQQPAQPAGQPLGGPQVAGVCLLSQQAVVANAKVGVAATARLKELAQQADQELQGERATLQSDAKALEGQKASLKPADFQARQQALATRAQAFDATVQQRSREIEATRTKALGQIAAQAQPVIASVYKAHNCGLLMDRTAVLGGNMTGDLTPDVVKGLDAKITTITFNRETLPAQTAAAK
jgi:Skp family chaperone for outer membrane proteins